jgi:hypothetical protein
MLKLVGSFATGCKIAGPMARGVILGLILLGEFGLLEAGLHVFGTMESQSAFQSLFIPDARIGYRLRPGISVRYSTPEFSNDLTINGQGVRDDEDIGPKAPKERRVLVLGDSYVFAVQVPLSDTFGEQLEVRLNESDPAHRWRVINGGVQGYGPVEEWLFYRHVASRFDPDIVLIVVSVANDAIEAFDAKAKLDLGRVPDQTSLQRGRIQLRQIVRSSLVLQLVRLRVDQLRARTATGTFERPLVGYLDHPPPYFFDGLQTAERAFGYVTAEVRNKGAKAALVLMPARFQLRDEEYQRLSVSAERAGSKLLRHAATERFATALARLDEPTLDLLPIFSLLPDPAALYFVGNSHLTARGHRVVAESLRDFLSRDRLTATTARE